MAVFDFVKSRLSEKRCTITEVTNLCRCRYSLVSSHRSSRSSSMLWYQFKCKIVFVCYATSIGLSSSPMRFQDQYFLHTNSFLSVSSQFRPIPQIASSGLHGESTSFLHPKSSPKKAWRSYVEHCNASRRRTQNFNSATSKPERLNDY